VSNSLDGRAWMYCGSRAEAPLGEVYGGGEVWLGMFGASPRTKIRSIARAFGEAGRACGRVVSHAEGPLDEAFGGEREVAGSCSTYRVGWKCVERARYWAGSCGVSCREALLGMLYRKQLGIGVGVRHVEEDGDVWMERGGSRCVELSNKP
jgi:hypothetical protein